MGLVTLVRRLNFPGPALDGGVQNSSFKSIHIQSVSRLLLKVRRKRESVTGCVPRLLTGGKQKELQLGSSAARSSLLGDWCLAGARAAEGTPLGASHDYGGWCKERQRGGGADVNGNIQDLRSH